MLVVLVLAVIGAAAGEMVNQAFGWPAVTGILALITVIAIVLFYGSRLIEVVFASWSIVLYSIFVLFLMLAATQFNIDITDWLNDDIAAVDVVSGSLRYVGYSLNKSS